MTGKLGFNTHVFIWFPQGASGSMPIMIRAGSDDWSGTESTFITKDEE